MTTIHAVEEIALKLVDGIMSSGGATVSAVVGESAPTWGYGVSGFAETLVIDYLVEPGVMYKAVEDFVARNIATVAFHGNYYLGAWVDPEDYYVHLDVTRVYSEQADAMSAARTLRQIAVWSFSAGEEIRL